MTAFTLPKLLYKESPNYSDRLGPNRLVVVHDCQGSYQGSIATFMAAGGPNPVSAHFVMKEDGSEVTQMVPLARKAWHCRRFNSVATGLEMAGFAERGFPESEWQAAANVTAWLLKHLGLPPVWAKGGVGSGFTSHFDLGKPGGGHSDPTTKPDVWLAFVQRVQKAYTAGVLPQDWPVK